jgi:hypothetical protein
MLKKTCIDCKEEFEVEGSEAATNATQWLLKIRESL